MKRTFGDYWRRKLHGVGQALLSGPASLWWHCLLNARLSAVSVLAPATHFLHTPPCQHE